MLKGITLALAGIATAVVLAVFAAGAGWWFLVRDNAALATGAPAIPQELVDTSATTASEPLVSTQAMLPTETFQIDPTYSEAAYFVEAEIGPLSSTIKLSTDQIDGQFYVDSGTPALAAGSTFSIDLSALTSDATIQNALDLQTYPTATFTVTNVTGYDGSAAAGDEQSLQVTGVLDLHGVQREVTWEVAARRQSNVIAALATITVSLSDFNVSAPTYGSVASISNDVTLQIQFIAEAI